MNYPKINGKRLTKEQKKEFDVIKDNVIKTLIGEKNTEKLMLELWRIDILSHNIATNLLGVMK